MPIRRILPRNYEDDQSGIPSGPAPVPSNAGYTMEQYFDIATVLTENLTDLITKSPSPEIRSKASRLLRRLNGADMELLDKRRLSELVTEVGSQELSMLYSSVNYVSQRRLNQYAIGSTPQAEHKSPSGERTPKAHNPTRHPAYIFD